MDTIVEGIKVRSDDSLTAEEVEATVRAEKVFYQAEDKQIESVEIFTTNGDILVRIREKTDEKDS